MKLYTRTGDEGDTALFGGPRVSKDDPRIDAYGTVDEVNAVLGMVRAELAGSTSQAAARLDDHLSSIQSELFTLGADLATPLGAKADIDRIDSDHIERLERHIDALDNDLPPLKNFILPGGSGAAATLHLARTVCRRAERLSVRAASEYDMNENSVAYLNRLSDYFFAAARWINQSQGIADPVWRPGP